MSVFTEVLIVLLLIAVFVAFIVAMRKMGQNKTTYMFADVGMNPLAFAEVARLLRKKKPTKKEQFKIQAAHECLKCLLGEDRVNYLVRLVDQDDGRI